MTAATGLDDSRFDDGFEDESWKEFEDETIAELNLTLEDEITYRLVEARDVVGVEFDGKRTWQVRLEMPGNERSRSDVLYAGGATIDDIVDRMGLVDDEGCSRFETTPVSWGQRIAEVELKMRGRGR